MRHQAIPTHSGVTYNKQFGGSPTAYQTRNTNSIMPSMPGYKVDGAGRDTFISFDNGGYYASYSPEIYVRDGPIHAKRTIEDYEKSLCKIPSKHVAYFSNGTGRDGYIARNNGGFYPEQTVAAYQQTYQNQLRIGYKKTSMNQ